MEADLSQYKKIVAELTLENRALKNRIGKKVVGAVEKTEVAHCFIDKS